MDLFEAFPSLNDIQHHSLDKKSLRLISLSGLVYDDKALYFEISPERYWTRLPEGKSVIGVGLPKVKPDSLRPPYRSLMEYLQADWHCDTNIFPHGYTFLMDVAANVFVLYGDKMPFFLQLTPPRLGGVNVPDALVQAVFLLPVQRFNWKNAHAHSDLMKIDRSGFEAFITRETWPLNELTAQTWCEYKTKNPLPLDAVARVVLTLRSLRELLHSDRITLDLLGETILN